MSGRFGRLAFIFFFVLTCGFARFAHAQSDAPASAATATSDAATPASNEAGPELDAPGPRRLVAWLAILISTAIGLVVYAYRRRLQYPLSRTWGYASAILALVVMFVLVHKLYLSQAERECEEAVLATTTAAANDNGYTDACRIARESAANFGGFTSAYRGASDLEVMRPIGSAAVQIITWASGLFWLSIVYWMLVPPTKKIFVHS